MKEFVKKHIFVISIVCAVLFLAIFLSFLFKKVGDDVYIINVNGDVSIGNSADLNKLKPAEVGMKLAKNDIIVTKDKSACVVSYSKKAKEKDNFINVGENSQVMLYSRNAQGGYNFYLTYGSMICNMSVDRSYRTNISSRLFNMFADGTITKVSYDDQEIMGKIFTFDGNPQIQLIQPSGSLSSADRLLKNSVCAIKQMDDGTIGFGFLNVGFGLNDLTAEDLKVMSGIANVWADKISYGVGEIEQAYQTADDFYKWNPTEPIITTEANEAFTGAEFDTETSIETEIPDWLDDEEQTVETVIPDWLDDEEDESDVSKSTSPKDADPSSDIYYTAFSRQTVVGPNEGADSIVTTVPDDEDEEDEDGEYYVSRTTAPYNSETTVPFSHAGSETTPYYIPPYTDTTTVPYQPAPNQSSTYYPYETVPYGGNGSYNAGSKPSIETAPYVAPDPNARFLVIFSYNVNGVEYWSIQLVRYGQSAIAPDEPVVPGKVFKGWDKNFSSVKCNMEVKAVFSDGSYSSSSNTDSYVATPVQDTYTVNFYVDSKLWKTVTVARGGTAVAPGVPVSSNSSLVFCGWSESLTDIRSDKNVFALFTTKS